MKNGVKSFKKRTKKIRLGLAAAAMVVSAATAAMGQSFPSHPITLIVPSAAGGPTDIYGRLIAEQMSKSLGQPIVIENVPGAGGTTGLARGKAAAPDGYTIMIGNVGMLGSAPALYAKLPYDPTQDFSPIGLMGETPVMIIARKNFPAANLVEFVNYVKTNAQKVTEANAGIGSATHSACSMFLSVIDTKVNRIAYRGMAPAAQDLLAGNVDFACDAITNSAPHVTAGTLKAFAVAAEKRSSILPDVPTTTEAGLPAFVVHTWSGFLAPKGVPPDVLNKLTTAFDTALDREELRKKLADLGSEVSDKAARTPAALQRQIETDVVLWRRVLKEAGIEAN